MKAKLQVLDQNVTTETRDGLEYICITDIARYKNPERTDDLIRNWLRNRNTIEFLGIWEQLNNPDFNPVEFDGFRKQAGLNRFTLTLKQWIENPALRGNVRDHATVQQLLCLGNLEAMNAHFIDEGLTQSERLTRLNELAIRQMSVLLREGRRLISTLGEDW